jgi:hypothetical protein
VIPIALLLGVLVGRWWFVPVAGLAWVTLLVFMNNLGLDDVPIAGGLAMANAAVGVTCHKLVAMPLRRVRGQSL